MAMRRRRHISAPLHFLLLVCVSSPPFRLKSPDNQVLAVMAAVAEEWWEVPGLAAVPVEGAGKVLPWEDKSPYERAKKSEKIVLQNNTLGGFPLTASTKEGPDETFEVLTAKAFPSQMPPHIPPLLHALLHTTAIAEMEEMTPGATTTSQHTHRPQGTFLGVRIPTLSPLKSWFPPAHNLGHQHGGKSRSGPYFEDGAGQTNVTARVGSTVLLDCKIGMLRDKTVTWLHRKHNTIHLLTVGRQAYSSDSRFSLAHRYPNNWRLQILFVNNRDNGLYECQVATHPPLVRRIYLRVTAPELKIVDEDQREVLERYYKAGSEVELTCIATHLEPGDGEEIRSGKEVQGLSYGVTQGVVWRHNDSVMTKNSSEWGIMVNVSTDGSTVSKTLTLKAAKKTDGGNYTCSVGGLASATASIHILNGELPAAVQYGLSTVPFGATSMLLQMCCLVLSLTRLNR